MSKLTSRKFWLCAAAFLASLGTSITALRSDNEIVATIGIICTIGSAAVYAAAEAYVDANRNIDIINRYDDDRSDAATVLADLEGVDPDEDTEC